MSLYRYKCKSCGEEFVKIEDRPRDIYPCPHCQDILGGIRQEVTSFSTRYKGKGFYNTDYNESEK